LLPAWGDIPLIDSLIDAVRSYSAGFMFRTALPPPICAAATAAIRHLKASNWGRERHQERAARVKAVLNAAALPVTPSDTHIVSVLVGDPERCKAASDLLLTEHGIYMQPINYPYRAAPERSGRGSRQASTTTTRSAMLSPRPGWMCGQGSGLR
jgi:7-keto-8-aminopelargonate synthetase-like enzyme